MTSQTLVYIFVVSISWLVLRVVKHPRARVLIMLVSSYVLYASWGLGFLATLVFSSLMNYILGIRLKRNPNAAMLWVGVTLNLVLLGTFKYVPAVLPLIPVSSLSILKNLILPVGMSFWTFQALSYLFDIYRGEDLDPTLLDFLLYMAFWPTALSGPICRLADILPSFRKPAQDIRLSEILAGADRVFIGLVMTACGALLASGLRAGQGLDAAFDGPVRAWSFLDVWCLAVGYVFELFFNFAGYSHIVIGAARIFGISLPENFRSPLLAKSASDFWNRWHMSLSFWIRDYLFLPLVMLRRDKWWRNASLMLSMIAFGIWHKGSVLFFLWGLYQGILLAIHRQWQQLQRRFDWRLPEQISEPVSWLLTFTAICLGFILFRANSLSQASAMFSAAARPAAHVWHRLPVPCYLTVLACGLGYFALIGADRLRQKYLAGFRLPMEIRLAAYSMAFYIGFLHMAETQSFVYFQF